MDTKIPNHIAFILDGNRRFAKRLMKKPWRGHEWGAKKVRKVVEWCIEAGVRVATLYSFSIQNFGRPKREFDFLMNLFEKEFLAITKKDHAVHKNKTRVKVIGRIYMLPKNVREAIKKAENATKNYKDLLINFAIAYGGQEEITDAVKKITRKVANGILKPYQINEKLIRHSLYTNGTPYPDLVIRTGGERRISNFLLWQSAYSEFVFIDRCWPEFTKRDFLKIIREYQKRDRRFGK